MGLQYINNELGYVVEFESLPALPVTGIGYEMPYAEALTDAIRYGVITTGGKYFIKFTASANDFSWAKYEVSKIED